MSAERASVLMLRAPLGGWSTPLEEAPDPVFAARMLGEGCAIDPTGETLHAPCDARVLSAPASRHAISLRAPNGAELLLHIGIDTVELAGLGFELHVREGDAVRSGDRLISFDLDLLAQHAKSVLTPLIVTNSERFALQVHALNRVVQVGEPWLALAPRAGESCSAELQDVQPHWLSRSVVVALAHGLHARPAGLVAKAVKALSAQVQLTYETRRADARSPLALMALGARHGAVVQVLARGADAARALEAVEKLLAGSAAVVGPSVAGPCVVAPGPVAGPAASAPGAELATPARDAVRAVPASAQPPGILRGVIASPGLAAGTAFPLRSASVAVREQGADRAHEFAELDRALDTVRRQLEVAAGHGNGAADAGAEIAAAHLELLDDPQLATQARQLIVSGKSAAFAWRSALSGSIECLRALGDARMLEREADLRDLESRVLSVLTGQSLQLPEFPPDALLIAEELLPSQLSALQPGRVAGVCLAAGGPTSHAAIIAASISLPMLVAAGPAVLQIPAGTPLVLDADAGALEIAPPAVRLAAVREQLRQQHARRSRERLSADRPASTADGMRIEVVANIGSEADARLAAANGAEGCGLLRTEFLFLERASPPDAREQAQRYQQIASALAGRPVVIRTLDAGGDKPIPYLPLPPEANPALGLRGVRTSLLAPELLRTQLRAILQVQPPGQCRVLVPMVNEPQELRAVRALLDELRREAGHEAAVQLGAMIETPAAATLADRIASEADFLSVGTNDLTQYVLAMDRGNPQLASRLDGLHPAVLQMLAATVRGAGVHKRHVAVCGGLASDPLAIPVLIGLGVHELSVVPGSVAQVKALIGTLQSEACRRLAAAALGQETAAAVRTLARDALTEAESAAPHHSGKTGSPLGEAR